MSGILAGHSTSVNRHVGEPDRPLMALRASKTIFVTDANFPAYHQGALRGGLPPGAIVHAVTPSQAVAALADDLGPDVSERRQR